MNELLRLANELIDSRSRAVQGEWRRGTLGIYLSDVAIIYDENGGTLDRDEEFIVQAANHAVDVIKGYQDLLRRVMDEWRNGDLVANNWTGLIPEIDDSLPQEKGND